jgi:hypothetical protein
VTPSNQHAHRVVEIDFRVLRVKLISLATFSNVACQIQLLFINEYKNRIVLMKLKSIRFFRPIESTNTKIRQCA